MSYQEKAAAAAHLARLRANGLMGGTAIAMSEPERTDGTLSEGYLKGALANVPSAAAAVVLGKKAEMEMLRNAETYKKWADANLPRQSTEDLLRNGPQRTNFAPYEAPSKVTLRQAISETMKRPGQFAKDIVRGLPGVGSAMAGIEGAIDGFKTPTEEYARRNGMEMPESTLGQVGLRGLGVLQDVGNAAVFGLPKKHLWK